MASEKKASFGSKVAVNLEGKFQDGTVFDTTENDIPFIFEVGEEDVPEGFSKAVDGLSEGETITVVLTPDEGYGFRDEALVIEISDELLEYEGLVAGDFCEVNMPGIGIVEVTVVEIREHTVILDFNDPLAGKTVVYKIELLKIY